jgi:formylglycine-generating enzyme required for sulfatase activity
VALGILLAAAGAGCRYDPVVPEGVIECRLPADCPKGYECTARPGNEARVCCRVPGCGAAGVGDDAAGSTMADAGSRADTSRPDAGGAQPDTASPVNPDLGPPPDGASPPDAPADAPGADVPAPPDTPPPAERPADTGPACPPSRGGPPLVRAGSFCIDATEVTNVQYDTFLMAKAGDTSGQPTACTWNTSYRPGSDGVAWPYLERLRDHPVVNVDWCDAHAFCKWAGKRLCGKIGGGRLTSWSAAARVLESQWTSACTGGGRTEYPYAGMFNKSRCNLDATREAASFIEPVKNRPMCEGGYPGIFDMSGNVMEWVDACDADSGRSDLCSSAGTSAWMGGLDAGDVACSDSHYGAPRENQYYFRGFRCCAD